MTKPFKKYFLLKILLMYVEKKLWTERLRDYGNTSYRIGEYYFIRRLDRLWICKGAKLGSFFASPLKLEAQICNLKVGFGAHVVFLPRKSRFGPKE